MFSRKIFKKAASIILSANMLYSGIFNNNVLYVVNAETVSNASAKVESPEERKTARCVGDFYGDIHPARRHRDLRLPRQYLYDQRIS